MDRATIIAELEVQRDRLNQAIAALRGNQNRTVKTLSGKPDGRKRKLSPAARKKISEALKKRWADRKKQAGE